METEDGKRQGVEMFIVLVSQVLSSITHLKAN
jgi:hypothetical protein